MVQWQSGKASVFSVCEICVKTKITNVEICKKNLTYMLYFDSILVKVCVFFNLFYVTVSNCQERLYSGPGNSLHSKPVAIMNEMDISNVYIVKYTFYFL
jgi:hypothetical protein